MGQASRSTFGKYVLLRKLASGGMGEIFLAKQRGPSGFEKLLVIKRILSHHLDKKDYLDMFFSEAKLVARLNHHNIIQIHEMGEIDGDYYIAMEYVRGKSLRDLIDELRAEGKTLPLPHVIDLAIKLCEGLGYAHQARDIRGRPMNIVHRDINPHNILISYTGDLKLIDFGIAKSEMTSVHTATGTIKGKFVYMSPEQSAADPIDRRSDIFSLGIVLYEMCCLENPFVRQNVVLSLEAIQRHDVAPPSAKRDDAGPLDDILMRALLKKPEERYQTAIEMRDELRSLFSDGSVRPAGEDLTSCLHKLFAADIDEEDRLLAEADQATQLPEPAVQATLDEPQQDVDLIDAPSNPQALPFPDEEETIAGDLEGIAAKSRDTAQRSINPPTQAAPTYHASFSSDAVPYPDPMPESGESLPHVPTRSDRIPTAESTELGSGEVDAGSFVPAQTHTPSGNEFPAPPMRNIDGTPSMAGPSPFAEPMPAASGLAATKEMSRAEPSTGVVDRRLARLDTPDYVTDEDSSMLQSPKAPWSNVGRFALYALVLIVTTVAGFLITRAMIAPDQEKRGVALLPIDVAGNTDDPKFQKDDPVVKPSVGDPKPDPANIVPAVDPGSSDDDVPEIGANPAPDKPDRPVKKKRRKRRKKRRRADRTKIEKKAPPPPKKVVEEPPPPPPPPKTRSTRLGTLTVKANAQVSVEVGGRPAGTSPAALAVRSDRGTIKLGGGSLPYTVTLNYRVTDSGVEVKVNSNPWSIVKHGGLSMGKTPQSVGAATRHKFVLLRPGQDGPFVVSLIWNPKP